MSFHLIISFQYILLLWWIFRVGILLNLPTIWTIVKKFGCFDPKIMALSPRVQRNIMEALMKACMQVRDEKIKEEFQTQVLLIYRILNYPKCLNCENCSNISPIFDIFLSISYSSLNPSWITIRKFVVKTISNALLKVKKSSTPSYEHSNVFEEFFQHALQTSRTLCSNFFNQ